MRRAANADAGAKLVYLLNVTGPTSNNATYEYTDRALLPYTHFRYRIRSCNGKGCADSTFLEVTTGQARPEGILAPQIFHIPAVPAALNLTWTQPKRPNGLISSYTLERNGTSIFTLAINPGPPYRLQFTDRGPLKPFTVYSYVVAACSKAPQDNCGRGPAGNILTLEAAPRIVPPPTLTAVNSTALKATWSKPTLLNGEVRGLVFFYLRKQS